MRPIKFKPILKPKIWGGERLAEFGKELAGRCDIGESWEISDVPGDVSVVSGGEFDGLTLDELIGRLGDRLLGRKSMELYGPVFPLLIKFLDARQNLSVQVHPDDEMARARGAEFGKNEMWYVMRADPGAQLISGFRRKVVRSEYRGLVAGGGLMEVLARENVAHGDAFFIPTGRIHALGAGIVVAEVQQTCDITYRVYDYDRRDAQGRARELHIEEAEEAINFDDISSGKVRCALRQNARVEVIDCRYFQTGMLLLTKQVVRDYSRLSSFVILICVSGRAVAAGVEIVCGETLLVPAELKVITITPEGEAELLEVWV